MKKILLPPLAIAGLFLIGALYSYKITEIPSGMTTDEASIGYNAVLISKTARDENGRFLPIFTLTINRSDWKQPSSIYLSAALFKLLPPSVFTLRLVSIIVSLVSLILVSSLCFLLLGKRGAGFAAFLYLTAPTVLMNSRLAQENIMPVPLITLWLLSLFLFIKKKNLKYLFFSSFILGLSIYSYKGMRVVVPVYFVASSIYLFLNTNLSSLFVYTLGFLPFVLIMPWLNVHYAGALFGTEGLKRLTYADFFYPYLASFDLSALFIKGDSTIWHSTGLHGVFLLASLPIFFLGLYLAVMKKEFKFFFRFLLIAFVLTPFLFGEVGSVHRFSRLLVFVPFYVIFSSLGFIKLFELKNKIIPLGLSLLLLFNFLDFAQYYFNDYPKISRTAFLPENELEKSYRFLSVFSKEKRLTPVFEEKFRFADSDPGNFYEASFFDKPVKRWQAGKTLPPASLLMSKERELPGLKRINGPLFYYYYFINEGEAIINP